MDSRNGSLGLAIVAVPNEDDSVYRVSSQPVPHMTILFLGDQSAEETQTIVEFVEHAAKQLGPFGMVKDYRGLLGSNDADVIFFEDNPVIERFRAMLLQNDTIKIAYESTDQFPSFNPHITLGYPDNPAIVDDDRNYYLGYTQFDRIAVWVDDYSGPEFRLKHDESTTYFSMSDGPTEDSVDISDFMNSFLEHSGVKGMRWGVRKDDKTGIARIAPKRRTATLLGDMGNEVGATGKLTGLAKLTAKSFLANEAVTAALKSTNVAVGNALFNGSLAGPAAFGVVGGLALGGNLAVIGGIQTMRAIFRPVPVMYAGAKKDIRKGVKALNEEFVGKTSAKDQDDYNNRYSQIVGMAFMKKKSALAHPFVNLAERSFGIKRTEAGVPIMTHISQTDKGKITLTITGPKGKSGKVNLGKIKHADESDEIEYAEIEILFQYGEDGRINDWYSPQLDFMDKIARSNDGDTVVHEYEDLSDFLEHSGVKGMRWGVRKDNKVGGSTFIDPTKNSKLPLISARRPARRPGDFSENILLGTGLNALGGAASALVKPATVRYAAISKAVLANAMALRSEFTAPGKDMRVDKTLQAEYDEKFQSSVKRLFTDKGLAKSLPSYVAFKRLGDIDDLKFDFDIVPGKKFDFGIVKGRKSDRGRLTITKSGGKKETVRVGKFKHSDDSDDSEIIEFDIVRDSDGFITDMVEVDDISHESEDLSDFLEHAGIMGMRWGVRRKLDEDGLIVKSDKGKPTDQVEKKAGSEDTEAAAKSASKLTEDGGGAGTLSNKEMTDLMNRIRNERTLAALINEDRRSDTKKQIDSMKEQMELDSLNAAQKEANRSVGSKLAGKLLESGTEMLTEIAKEKVSDYGDSVLESMGFSKPKSLKEQADEAKHRFEIANYGDKMNNIGGSKKKKSDYSDDSGGSENSPKKSKVKSAIDSVKEELSKPAISEESARLSRETRLERDIDNTTTKAVGSLKKNSVGDAKDANERAKRLLETTDDINDWMDVQNSKLTRKFGHDDEDESQPSITHEDLRDLVKMIARG